MTFEILQVPDCPGAAVLEARLAGLLEAHPGLRIIRRIVTTQADAERLGMTGSPTLLADGVDPFARPGQQPSTLVPPVPRRARPPEPRALIRAAQRRARAVTGQRLRNSGERRRASATRRAVPKVLARRRNSRPPP